MENIQGSPTFRVKEFEIAITHLPMPPSENMAYPTGRNGRRYKSAQLVQFQLDIQRYMQIHNREKHLASQILKTWLMDSMRLSIILNFYFTKQRLISKKGTTKKLDVTNRLKAICDSISESLDFDDCNFWQVKCDKSYFGTNNNEWCSIIIRPFTESVF